jgi:hypothetical protein
MPEDRQISIREAVADTLLNLSERTRNQVVEHFAAIEATKQANAIVAGLDKLSALENERRRIKPNYQGFDIEGKGVGETLFTKEQVEQNKKLGEQIDKLTRAVTKADEKADFGDLYNLAK